ncbi:rho GTPase-activating protein REN1 isoform X2 [Impatiens glandulifera]|uniref:rho GTPase-activating protein REN1 isoform X2 n=1 Tax=Impatiens glandulifera TaxID=253017 RepID=UPI001FB06D75|nr:rho GTPase-activating protein REN1 isoform X2 [Impatiens glandulifera]
MSQPMNNPKGDPVQSESGAPAPVPAPAPAPASAPTLALAPVPAPAPAPVVAGPPEHLRSRAGNKVFKSGPLLISSKGIGWTSWKKRWFILTRTSLVFFRTEPNATAQKGSEVNLTLGGIDLNNSGSVVVKADKKLLTVLFPDGRDGRAFTLKSETLEDLHEWKTALEEALAQAPSPTLVMGQTGIFKNEADDESGDQVKDRQPVKSMVIGRPVLLALEDIDGTPSFLEKALRYMEEHGVKVEGVLRQAADVDDVERRIQEYEQGKTEFSEEEDAHVIGDCIKYVIRELPSSPVPASCCKALLEACKTDRNKRAAAMREAICETFPEPNRRLLQRILIMMTIVASHKAVNRMSTSAVAACMAPLLLRPLLAGDCELENDFDVGGDGSMLLLQAAAAANHAQAIVITLLEEYDKIFGEVSASPELYTESDESGSEELTDDEAYDDDDEEYDDEEEEEEEEDDDGEEEEEDDEEEEIDDDHAHASTGACSGDDNISDNKGAKAATKDTESDDDSKVKQKTPLIATRSLSARKDAVQTGEKKSKESNSSSTVQTIQSGNGLSEDTAEAKTHKHNINNEKIQQPAAKSLVSVPSTKRASVFGRSPASGRKDFKIESADSPAEVEEEEILKLEAMKLDLQKKIDEEVKINASLQAKLEKRKDGLHSHRLVLQRDVLRLKEQLQKERDLRTVLEAGLKYPQGPIPVSIIVDEKIKADLDEMAEAEANISILKKKVDDLESLLHQQRELNSALTLSKQDHHPPNMKEKTDIQSSLGRVRSKKDSRMSRADSGRELKPNRRSSQNQQSDLTPTARSGSSKPDIE